LQEELDQIGLVWEMKFVTVKIFMTQSKEYKVYCKVCDKECSFIEHYKEFRCGEHYKFRFGSRDGQVAHDLFVEILYYGPYTMVTCNGWNAYGVWFHPYYPVKSQVAEQFLFTLNLSEPNFKSEEYVIDKLKKLHIFS
jgi:hypothetical protein